MSPQQRPEAFQLGQRVKALREALGISQRELARRAQVTNANLSMIELDKVSPAMSTLEKIVNAMEFDLPTFFAAAQPLPPVVQAGAFSLIRRKGAKFRVMSVAGCEHRYLAQATINADADIGQLWVTGPGSVSGLVLSGQLQLRLNDVSHPLNPGDGFAFLLNRKYRFVNAGHEPANLVIFVEVKP